MGKPVIYKYKDRELKFCCKDCIKDFNKDPQKYHQKLEEKPKLRRRNRLRRYHPQAAAFDREFGRQMAE